MTQTPSTPPPPPGWYPSQGGMQWWDGQQWTGPVQPAGQQTAPLGQSVSYVPVQTNHTFHLIATVLTCGLWGIVWVIMILVNKSKKDKVIHRY